jgi:uncharacterized protein
MGLIRILIILVLAYLAWQLIKTTLARTARLRGPGNDRDGASGEKMVPCARCGVHVPAGEAVQHRNLAFCSQAHQDDFLADHGD